MMMVNLALAFSLSTLVIANLHRSGVELSMDDTVASWFGKPSNSLICLFIKLSGYVFIYLFIFHAFSASSFIYSYLYCLFIYLYIR
jgi:hypothetical protein